jgi:hypothetical protein
MGQGWQIMTEKSKTRTHYVLDALRSEKAMNSRQIREMVASLSGEIIHYKHILQILNKITDPRKAEIGPFITKNKNAGLYEYRMVPEIFGLTAEEMYDLTIKQGRNRFTQKIALKKIPQLKKYVKKAMQRKEALSRKSTFDSIAAASEPETDMMEHAPSQQITFSHLKGIFEEEARRAGGMKVNFRFKAQLRKN